MHRPFLRLDAPEPGEILTDAFVQVLGECGLDRFSVGALARWMKVTPAAVLKANTRSEVVRIVAVTFGERWLDWVSPRLDDPLPARLPRTDDELQGVRVWHALAELARGEALAGRHRPEAALSEVRRIERRLLEEDLAARIRRTPTAEETTRIAATVVGLRQLLAAGSLTYDEATASLEATAGVLRSSPTA